MNNRNLMQFISVASTAAAWLQLLLLTLCCCCCFVSSQQMHIANPYKYQQLQYQMLQHQQQQYEYQKHIQQLYLQQQIKLQQQKQQQQQIHQQLLAEQEKAEMQKLLEQQEQEKLLQQQLQQQQQQQKQEEKLLQLQILQQKQQQHATYSMPLTLPIQMPQSPQQYEQQLQHEQQQQQQQHTIFPLSVSLTQQHQMSPQQKDARLVSSTQEQQLPQQVQHFSQLSSVIPTQSQMLQTSASLIVDDECDEEEDSSEIVQKESTEYRINITPETIQEAQLPARQHPEVISLTDPEQQPENDYNVASSIAPSAETIDFWRGFIEDEEVSVPAPTSTALAATLPTAAAATAKATAPTAKATAPTSTATAAVRPTATKRITTTAAAATSAASLTSTGPVLTSSDSTAYDSTAPAFTSSAAALTATATAATASLAAVAPRSTVDISTARQRKDTRPKTAKRRRKPAAVREPLAALEKEQKLYELRDRQRQEFVADVASAYRDKSYRRPYSQSKKQDDSHESTSNATVTAKHSVELKNILKKSGGMSLSEILQQKNLSLDDLLKGKQTALLALQTTSATAPLQDATPVRKKKPQRRIVPTAYTPTSSTTFSASAETFSSGESESSEQRIYGKNKLKFPALQRLKLFGTSSRGAAAHSGEGATAKRRDTNITMARSTSTTTTTTTTTTTKRVPIYRKRQQLLQRTTLKPLGGLLKASTSTAQTVTKAPVKILPTAMESKELAEEEFDELTEAEEKTMPITSSSSIISSSTTTTTTTTATPIPTKSSTTSSSRRSSSSSVTTAAPSTETRTQANIITRTQTNAAVQTPTNTKSRAQTKYALDITNPKTNSIEHDDDTPPSSKSTESGETAVTYADDDLEDFFEEATTKRNANNSAISSSTTFPNSLAERLTPRSDRYPVKPTSDYENLPYVDPVDDRTDLLELIEDRRSGNRLFKVLEQRNMTLEELIEHRKRGSSQLHLAMVVQNRSRFFPDKKVILRDNMDIVTAFENFPHFNLMNLKSVKPDEIKTDSQGSSYFTSIIDIEPTDEIYRDGNKEAGSTSNSVGKSNSESDSVKGPSYAQLQRTEKSLGFLPPWKTLALASSSVRTGINQNPAFYLPQPKLLLDTEMENNDSQEFLPEDNELLINNDAEQIAARHTADAVGAIDTAEAIENEVARAHDLLDLELSGHGFKRSPTAAAASMANQKQNSIYGNMPAGIRSAIVASAAIVLTSLATFMVIFVVCRWKQHRKRKTNYMKTYNAMKSKLPMIATTTTSRQSTLHRHHIEDSSMVQSSGVQQSHPQQQQQQLHQPNARLFRSSSSHSLGGGIGVTLCSSRLSSSGSGRLGSGGMGTTLTGSTTSLALSLQSAHNISSTKLNTMDPNSPEVQEYLFDALRKSF